MTKNQFKIFWNFFQFLKNLEALNQKWGFWGFPNGHFKLWQVPPIIYTWAFLYFDMWQSYAHNNFQPPCDLSKILFILLKIWSFFTKLHFRSFLSRFRSVLSTHGSKSLKNKTFFQYFDSASGRCNILLSFLALIVKGSFIGSPQGYHPPPWKNWVKLNAISIPIS